MSDVLPQPASLCACCVFNCSGSLQGFDKYGVWACGAHPVPNLQKALNLKVGWAVGGPCGFACLASSQQASMCAFALLSGRAHCLE